MSIKDIFDDIIDLLGNPIIVGVLFFIALVIIWLVKPDLWILLFSIILSYFVADAIANVFVRGGSGLAQIPLFGNQIQERGHAYLFFLIAIVFGTVTSGFISDNLGFLLEQKFETMLLANSVILALSFVDFLARFYENE